MVREQLAHPVSPLLQDYAQACLAWGTATGQKYAAPVLAWLAADLDTRIATFDECELGWLTGKREPRKVGAKGAAAEAAALAIRLFDWSDPIHGLINLARQADRAADAVRLGRAYALRHARAKEEAGFVDYDDLIRRAVTLLQTPGMGEWVRKKLDQSTDHVLIDEAQDTNAAQWDIIKALTEEYFAGASAAGNKVRTLFTVGDYKQAIFGFQGTDPENFRAAQAWFAERAGWVERDLLDLSLTRSFRSAQPILDVTDAVIGALGHEALGMSAPVPAHHSFDTNWPGEVMLVPPVMVEGESSDEGDEEWLGESERLLAARIADQIHDWWKANPLWIARKRRFMVPGDVMILLRKRGELARLLVARLNERGIPVAGLDRLRLGAPLAVQDLLACARFAMQPEDDLNLAALLVSPLIGLNQDQLYEAAKGRKGALWPRLDDALRDQLMPVLNAADMTSPYRFFETILSGSMQGRTKLLARLGDEARDPLDALLSAALDFEATHPPSLQLFLDWFDRSDSEIKRDAEAGGGAVRVMTAHGAKGLQAPIVILADAAGDPTRSRPDAVTVPLPGGESIALPRPPASERTLSLKALDEARQESDLKEHRRLLYVALTRAEERLLITGALKKGDVPATSWHAAVAMAMDAMQAETSDAPIWAAPVRRVTGGDAQAGTEPERISTPPAPRPVWLDMPPAPEAAPQRPLSPSSLGHDDASDPPPSPAMAQAAERGRLLHALFERLPALPIAARRAAGERWLAASAGIADTALHTDLLDTALGVIDDPAFAHVFTPDALAEAPLAGVVDGFVVAGTVDRLLVDETEILIVDFKTGRFVPRGAEAAPVSHLRQMAAYAALLTQIFPDRPVRAALLYTHGPRLIDLPPALLARHKPNLAWQQEVLQQAG
jgi:ATP-dependent helicase/nuclease subunit A